MEQGLPFFDACGPDLKRLRFELDKVSNAYRALLEVLGEEWYRREVRNRRGHLFKSHPLLNVFGTASLSSISLALELALALKTFQDEPGLSDLVRDLRLEDACDGATFTLSVALRFHLLGFTVELEKPTQRGSKSDVFAARGEESYVIECTARRGLQVVKTNEPLYLEILRKAGLQSSVLIDLEVQDTPMEQEATALFREILTEYARKGTPLRKEGQRLTAAARPLRRQELSEHDFPKTLTSDWEWSQVFLGFPEDEPITSPSQATMVVLVRLRPARFRPLEEIVDAQLRKKRAQLSCHPANSCSLIFVQVEGDVAELDTGRLGGRLQGDHFKALPNLGAVILSQRKWTDADCYQQDRQFFLNERATPAFPATLAEKLTSLETRFHLSQLVNDRFSS